MDNRSDSPDPAVARAPESMEPIGAASPAASLAAAQVAEFSEFYRAFVPRLVSFLLWQGAQLADAAEIAQDTMAQLYRSWGRVEHRQAWTRAVASRSYARRIANIEEPIASPPDEPSPLLPDAAGIHQFVERHEVLRLLALLPVRQRQVMAWTYDGHNPTEIAEQLSMTPAAVRASLLKARRSLVKHLAVSQEVQSR